MKTRPANSVITQLKSTPDRVKRLPVVGFLLLSTLIISACTPGNADDQTESPLPKEQAEGQQNYHHLAQSAVLEQETGYSVQRRFVGNVQVKQNASLGFEQAGKIASLHFDEGDSVQQGALLASQDTELLQIERQELQAQLSENQAQLNLTRANLKRLNKLKKSGFTSTQSLDELQSQQKVFLASRLRVQAALDANQVKTEKARLYAPFTARISQRLQDSGTVVNAGTPVFQLLQESNNEVKVGVPVRLLDKVQQAGLAQLEIAGKIFPAKLLAVGADVNPITRTVALRFALPNDIRAVNGQLAYLTVDEIHQGEGYWVPLAALTDGVRGMWNVYSLRTDSSSDGSYKNTTETLYTLESRNINVLHATESQAYISGALSNGERILTGGLHRLVPGQQVRLKTETLSQGDIQEQKIAGVQQ